MKILCSSNKIKITFAEDSEFSGRSLRMNGEALNNGFDADADSMTWLAPYDSEVIDNSKMAKIIELITVWNSTKDFQILFMNTAEGNNMTKTKIGDIIKFGEYHWRVLDIQDGKALILAEKAVEQRAFHTQEGAITWEECELRAYLNGEFLAKFGSSRIAQTTISNNNPRHKTGGSNDTTDSVFLLSFEDVGKYFGDQIKLPTFENPKKVNSREDAENSYWYSNYKNAYDTLKRYFDEDKVNHGAKLSCCRGWWLRSLGKSGYAAAVDVTCVRVGGHSIGYSKNSPNCDGRVGVRPAMWLNL